jgi:hypothetical protein
MGIDTRATFGVSYTCTFEPENYNTLTKLSQLPHIMTYLPHGDCEDEVCDIDNVLSRIDLHTDFEQDLIDAIAYCTGRKFDAIIGLNIIFVLEILDGDVKNIARRRTPMIYNECSSSPQTVCEMITHAIDLFKLIVPEDTLAIGYTISQS